MSDVSFGKRQVGDGHPVFVVFEAGPTHNGVESAKRLIDHAADAGSDAIKFQIFDPDRLVADRSIMFEYEVLVDRATGKTERVSEPLYDLMERRSLSENEWKEVKAHADKRGLAFFATVGFNEEIDLVERLRCHSIKIASGDVNHYPLIRYAARTGLCLQLDTGSSSLGEIEAAIDIARSEGNEQVIVHQCPSGYPARIESVNLNIIPTLKRLFSIPVAFSDHTPGHDMDVAAVALGANLVEKTITDDRMPRSIEHIMSIEPDEMKAFIKTIRDVEIALGSSRRILHDAEKVNRLKVRRSVFLKEQARAGTKLSDLSVDFRRPGDGIAPDEFERHGKNELVRDLAAGHKLTWSDFE